MEYKNGEFVHHYSVNILDNGETKKQEANQE